ncbi:polymer-forming cytoskeletal protein [Paraburkholderia sp. CNPSo 3274]|uniref:bactofilin family protein n=1 Tax=unclassified Paraburkholderia TaxID=2615204 RepID=UPI0020B8930D|nr:MULTISPECIES: polymer-forming cytoskeletal protein [unclassified Paraburkholderia]MCP3712457.1 polymer-forming cytoskeletal protein [Paraburkholderia sp. CNPSo 3274]MCP3718454.1 polymer-forming cytoskeletal protein [Paraburkholderia sp. CNPSo 3281]MCP3724619.1 polymer-forming cytoskeletal protein [Paraburkholderia sp. CNPSo 3272]
MKSQHTLNVTLLAPGSTIEGNLILDHGVSLFGIVDGNLISNEGLLHVGAGGLVKGQIEGEHVRIDGTVEGDLRARGSLEINGRVRGNIFYCGTIRLGERASLEGQLKRVARELTIDGAVAPENSNVQHLPRASTGSA